MDCRAQLQFANVANAGCLPYSILAYQLRCVGRSGGRNYGGQPFWREFPYVCCHNRCFCGRLFAQRRTAILGRSLRYAVLPSGRTVWTLRRRQDARFHFRPYGHTPWYGKCGKKRRNHRGKSRYRRRWRGGFGEARRKDSTRWRGRWGQLKFEYGSPDRRKHTQRCNAWRCCCVGLCEHFGLVEGESEQDFQQFYRIKDIEFGRRSKRKQVEKRIVYSSFCTCLHANRGYFSPLFSVHSAIFCSKLRRCAVYLALPCAYFPYCKLSLCLGYLYSFVVLLRYRWCRTRRHSYKRWQLYGSISPCQNDCVRQDGYAYTRRFRGRSRSPEPTFGTRAPASCSPCGAVFQPPHCGSTAQCPQGNVARM